MKTEKSLWTSVSILVGTVILILGIARGPWQTWLLLGTFAIWAGWGILCLLMPYINRAKQARYRKQQQERRILDAYAPIEMVRSDPPSESVQTAMMQHVNFRITAYIRSIYPEAAWEWCEQNPVSQIGRAHV